MASNEQTAYSILYIEDNDILRMNTLAFLEDEGYEVYGAENGREGIEKFNTLKPMIVVSDLKMPEIGGLEVLETIKRTSPGTEVIIVSGTRNEEDLVKCINNGAYRYIAKPANLVEISSIIKSAIELIDLRRREVLYTENLEEIVKERTQQLKESEELYRNILANIEDGYLELDLERNIIFLNDALCRILGYSRDELLHLNYSRCIVPQDLDKITQVMTHVHETGIPEKGIDYEILMKDQSIHSVESSITLKRDAADQVIGYRSILRDITERKKAEEELQQYREHLEELVQERTEELRAANKKIVETARLAGKAEIAIGVLHNIGNILNSIGVTTSVIKQNIETSRLGGLVKLTEMFEEHALDLGDFIGSEKGKKAILFMSALARQFTDEQSINIGHLNELKTHIDHMSRVVSLQQAFSGNIGLMEDLSIDDLVTDTVKILDESITRHNIQLKIHRSDLQPASFDRHRILQILVNLINNAKDSVVKKGGNDKQISIEICPLEKNHVAIRVTDNGIGIPPEKLTKIFQFGYTTKDDGHGFGLHSSANVAGEMGGKLMAQSEGKGHGATFTLELPYNSTVKTEKGA